MVNADHIDHQVHPDSNIAELAERDVEQWRHALRRAWGTAADPDDRA
jgi:hypothetical protein